MALSIAALRHNGVTGRGWETNPQNRIEQMLCAWLAESGEKETIKNLFRDYALPGGDADVIGAFYQSVQSAAKKATLGAYYTPPELLRKIAIPRGKTVYDPCCGSGGVLLKILDKTHDPALVFASDIDDAALKICAVNLSLFFGGGNAAPDIGKRDIVFPGQGRRYDYIVTNPPWGYKFSRERKKEIARRYPELETTEIFSIALSNCLDMLEENGTLYFFLPHAFLNVAAHKNIRRKLLHANGSIDLRLLGSAFRGVMSETILLRFDASGPRLDAISITGKNGTPYSIPRDRIAAPCFIIPATIQNTDAVILEKIYAVPHTSLAEGGIFALGIVTGNNRQCIQTEKTAGSEAIYRGKDIFPYRFALPECFIAFEPEKMQQAARTAFYRQRKIAYRFIYRGLVCVLDEQGSLLLNSANLFISPGYPMETIVCLFNSPVYTFVCQKKFHSRKVLQSHLRDLPLPFLSAERHGFFHSIHSGIVTGKISPRAGQAEIDAMLAGLFTITDDEYTVILGETNRIPDYET